MISYLPRTLETFVAKASRKYPALLVTGARQVGKTTLLRRMMSGKRTYVTLDDPLTLALAREDPALFFQRFAPPLFIDEIQNAPQLLPYIKMQSDTLAKAGLFWLTGSQQFPLMKGVSESLAGRIAVVQLQGLSRQEIEGRGKEARPFLPSPRGLGARATSSGSLPSRELFRSIWRGSFPAMALDPRLDWTLFYGSYVKTYLERDVRKIARVGDELAFLRFLRVTAARTAQLLNMADLARDADVAPNTAKNWLSILQASGIVYLLEPYHTNLTKRLVRAPKLYFLDTGLCAYLTEWSSSQTLEAGAMSGAILETWVITELLKSYWHNGRRPPFYFYRDRDLKEIDLLIVQDDIVYPIEVKKTASPTKQDVRHFPLLESLELQAGPGGVICLAEQLLPLTPGAWAIPAALL